MAFLKSTIVEPRRTALLSSAPGNLHEGKLDAFLFLVWNSLQSHLADPIQVVETEASRTITFMGCVRYVIQRDTGAIHVETLQTNEGRIQFRREQESTSIDLPGKLTGFWLDAYLLPFRENLALCLIDHYRPGPGCWHQAVKQELVRSLRLSTHWRKLRHALRDALGLDRQILNWFRHGRHRYHRQLVSDRQYNWAIRNRRDYEQLVRENPNLLWLFNFALGQGVELNEGDVVAALKSALIDDMNVSEAGWRYLTRSHRNQFQNLIDWIGPDGQTDGRWAELTYWLRTIVMLGRKEPIAPAVMRLFFHDSFDICVESHTIKFRSAWLKPGVVRTLIAEAERRQHTGTLQSFVENDLVEVMAWLEIAEPELDKNQIRQGWKYLGRQAVQWKVEMEAKDELQYYAWECHLPEVVIGLWTVKPISDAWQLRQEALAMRHCCDRYLMSCMVDKYRIYSVRNAKGKRVGTIGLEFHEEENCWKAFGIRSYANTSVPETMAGLDEQVAQRYTDLYRLLQQETAQDYSRRVEQRLKAQECEDDEDEIEEEEEESPDNACPICGASLSDQGCDHMVAIYDVTFGELEGGELYEAYRDIHNGIEDVIRQAADTGNWNAVERLELGIDRLTNTTSEMVENFIADCYGTIREKIFSVLEEMAEVTMTEWEFDACRPGGCSWYRGYWAHKPNVVVRRLQEEFACQSSGINGSKRQEKCS